MTIQELITWLGAVGAPDAEVVLTQIVERSDQPGDIDVWEFVPTGDGSRHVTLGTPKSDEFHVTIRLRE